MTLAEFIASREESADVGAVIGDDLVEGMPGYTYLGSLYIERLPSGVFNLRIGTGEHRSADIAELESKLFDAAVSEGLIAETGDERRTRLAAAYVERIGYDPFEDDPTISADEVEQALRDHALEIAKADAEASKAGTS